MKPNWIFYVNLLSTKKFWHKTPYNKQSYGYTFLVSSIGYLLSRQLTLFLSPLNMTINTNKKITLIFNEEEMEKE